MTDITVCISCKQKWPAPHLLGCPYYSAPGNVDGVEPPAHHPMCKNELSGRHQGKTAWALDIILDRLEKGQTVWCNLSDEI